MARRDVRWFIGAITGCSMDAPALYAISAVPELGPRPMETGLEVVPVRRLAGDNPEDLTFGFDVEGAQRPPRDVTWHIGSGPDGPGAIRPAPGRYCHAVVHGVLEARRQDCPWRDADGDGRRVRARMLWEATREAQKRARNAARGAHEEDWMSTEFATTDSVRTRRRTV